MASNISNNTIRENDNGKGHINLTMDDVLNGTINNTINLLLRTGNRMDLNKLLGILCPPSHKTFSLLVASISHHHSFSYDVYENAKVQLYNFLVH